MNDLNKKEGDQKFKNAECDDVIFITSLNKLYDCLSCFLCAMCVFTFWKGVYYLALVDDRFPFMFIITEITGIISISIQARKQKNEKKLADIKKNKSDEKGFFENHLQEL